MTPCILYTGTRFKGKYGWVQHQSKAVLAHRLAYAQANKLDVWSMGGIVMHTCDNPPCINPEHLQLSTQRENVLDMHRKGRGGHTKLTHDQVSVIRSRYVAYCPINGSAALGREFGVSQPIISRLVNGHIWKDVGGDVSTYKS